MQKLQNIIYPSTENCTEESLYFRRFGNVEYSFADKFITLNKEATVTFDTYFNSFSAGKWYKYTKIQQVGLCLKLKGSFRITLWYKEKQANQLFTRVVKEFYCNTEHELKEIFCEYDTEFNQGMYALSLLSLEDSSEFHSGYYYTEVDDKNTQNVRISLVICTFKREKYIYKNMKMLCNSFLDNPTSELYDNLEIVISDNADSLDISRLNNDKIHIFKNKNTGGSGGFTRGMIESINLSKKRDITHVLLMDDDVVMQTESIYRTYKLLTLLKPEYTDTYVGGAMLRTDNQWFQTESGGCWNNGALVGNKCGLDLRTLDACLYNEFEETSEFNAWWYCTIPMKFVREDNLPLPIFIRGDDVEYGLRNMKHLILMNGICVWHEPFEFKYNSSMFYYIFRNKLIDNAVHGKPYTKKMLFYEFKELFKYEVFTMRYKNAWLLLKGVNDFMKGIDFLLENDGEELNKEIMSKGYKLQYVDELSLPFSYPEYERTLRFFENKKQQKKRIITLNGLFQKATRTAIVPVQNPHIAYFYRVSTALNYDISSKKGFVTYRSRKEVLKLFKAYLNTKKNVKKNYRNVVNDYKTRKSEVTNIHFWNKYLDI